MSNLNRQKCSFKLFVEFESPIFFFLFFSRAPSDPSKTGKRPPVAADSEVYKMMQENQESDEPPRQSASFKVLQEILETGMIYHLLLTASSKGLWGTRLSLGSDLIIESAAAVSLKLQTQWK